MTLIEAPPSALSAFYGQEDKASEVDSNENIEALLQVAKDTSLTQAELDAASTLHSMLHGASWSPVNAKGEKNPKLIQVPTLAMGFTDFHNTKEERWLTKSVPMFQSSVEKIKQPNFPRRIKPEDIQINESQDGSKGILKPKDAPASKSRYSAFRKASMCPFCAEIGQNCGKVAAKCPNRPCAKCNRRHRLNRCKRTHCKHCLKEDHLSSKCPIKLREWSRASVQRRREQRLKEQGH